MTNLVSKTSKTEQKVALSSIDKLIKSEKIAIEDKSSTINLTIQNSEEVVEIPVKALKLLTSIIENMAEGKEISVLATDTVISTQKASEILNVSRPHVVKLLETGEIPFKKVGSHRRIMLEDVLKYEAKFQKQRRKLLNKLTKEAQELNLGY